jgi:hypothetical protein
MTTDVLKKLSTKFTVLGQDKMSWAQAFTCAWRWTLETESEVNGSQQSTMPKPI